MISSDEQDRKMAQFLAEMSVLSEVSAHSYDVTQVHGGEADRAPRGTRQTMADYYHVRWLRASGPTGRRLILLEAEAAISHAKRAQIKLMPGTLEWRVAIAHAPQEPKEVARIYGVSRGTVAEFRLRYGTMRH